MSSDDKIFFFREYEDNGYLSNWYSCSFYGKINKIKLKFHTSEQYFMAYKAYHFKDRESFDKIMNTNSPKYMKNIGAKIKNFDTASWDKIKIKAMYKAIKYKFTQNEELLNKLLSTNNSKLFEASPYDKIWGIGINAENAKSNKYKNTYPGQNLLGRLLMKLRTSLKNEK